MADALLVSHDSRDRENLVEVGELRPGLPLRLNRAAVETDLLITVGSVRHHYFAGFGGGPKMVFPGIAGYEEIQANHSLVVRSKIGEWQREPACERGVLHQNPIAEEIARAAEALEPDCAVCLVPGRNGGVAWAEGGYYDSRDDEATVDAFVPNSEIRAMVGSVDYWDEAIDGSFNVAVDGQRQPGSSFKPFTYLTALSQGYTPATMVLDVETDFGPQAGAAGVAYVPQNYDRDFHGPMSLRQALANIQSGDYARRFLAEGATGYPEMTAARKANADHDIERVGEKLRAMMPWIAANKIVDKSRN